MRHANAVVAVSQRELQKVVGNDGRGVSEPEERVVREDCLEAHRPGMEHGLMGQRGERRVAVDNVDPLPREYAAQDGQRREQRGQDALVVEGREREVVDLEVVGQVVDALPAAVGVSDDYDLVPALEETLAEEEDVGLDAADAWVEEVWHHAETKKKWASCMNFDERSQLTPEDTLNLRLWM